MSNAVKRAIRTFLQGFLGSTTVGFTLQAGNVLPDLNFFKRLFVSALFGGGSALFSFWQNALEDKREETGKGNPEWMLKS